MTTSTCFTEIDSPVGLLYVRGNDECVTGLFMPNHKHWSGPEEGLRRSDDSFKGIREQLAEYFAGDRQEFDIPVELDGTPFQQRVWEQLTTIPFGQTISYAELARRVGNPTATRAVGAANGRNPVSILVPCHRVIGSHGSLTGYGGGLHNKEWLLNWERTTNPRTTQRQLELIEA